MSSVREYIMPSSHLHQTFWLLIVSASITCCGNAQVSGTARGPGASIGYQMPKADAALKSSLPVEKATAEPSEFTLGVPDVIHINVWKNPELSETVTIRPDGFISLVLLGDVRVAGLTTSQLSGLLMDRFASFIVKPQVTVSVVEIHSRQVYVMGQVAKPGGFPLVGSTNVLQILAEAGGLSTFANRKGIYVLRSENGHVARHPFNYAQVIHGKSEQNLTLQPGDTVVVP